ncbi:MAG: undecaprenyldiphospho-muramoylpentapeptide beta-N-acetylglucosaminyltransferase [Candidatus Dadabacteria bacterium]|nr:undecaprenyldiphospho-muramoylpentapeptide beta-N-acetylglucosaminyltransferase [Candidatus Dadabacteria bacterium]
MRVIIAGGGTGGHVFPAISIAEEILERNSANEVLFVGTKQGIEKRILTEKGYRAEFINSRGLVGKNFLQKVSAVISILGAIVSAMQILRNFRPDAVIGVGGYASGPTLLCASMSSVPTAVCEQNSVPGLTNRILSRFVGRIFITFEESREHLPEGKAMLTGNPIRRKLVSRGEEKKTRGKAPYNVFVLGGSQGAQKLNEIVPHCLAKLGNRVNVTHQSGEAHTESVAETYRGLGIEAEVFGFTDDMSRVYKKTDLVICRAGSGTICEITAFGIPSVLIPLASSTHNHQLKNARVLESAAAAAVVEEKELSTESLFSVVEKVLEQPILERMAKNSKKLARPHAAQEIVDEIERIIKVK